MRYFIFFNFDELKPNTYYDEKITNKKLQMILSLGIIPLEVIHLIPWLNCIEIEQNME